MRSGPLRTSSWPAGGVSERPEVNCPSLALKQTLYCDAGIRTAVHKTNSSLALVVSTVLVEVLEKSDVETLVETHLETQIPENTSGSLEGSD